MTEHNIFCQSDNLNDENSFQQKKYRAFNKDVGETRYREILDLIRNDILKDLKLELNENSWEDEWKKVTAEQWQRILTIPEADKKVIEKIIGFELRLDEPEIEIDGKKYSKSTIKNALKDYFN